MKKHFKIIVAVLLGIMLVAGCGSNESSSPQSKSADGRIGDTLTNSFFSFCVNRAELKETFEGETPTNGMVYLVAEITVKNVFGEELPMFSSDFQVQWGEEDEDYGYTIDKLHDSQMDDEFTMKKGETVTKLCVYEVPMPQGETEYSISYLELFESGKEGDVFFIYFDLEPPSGRAA